jgi:hypothetical protein
MALPGATRSKRVATLEQAIADFGGKSYTPLNAARVAHAAQPVTALGRPIFHLFYPFVRFRTG